LEKFIKEAIVPQLPVVAKKWIRAPVKQYPLGIVLTIKINQLVQVEQFAMKQLTAIGVTMVKNYTGAYPQHKMANLVKRKTIALMGLFVPLIPLLLPFWVILGCVCPNQSVKAQINQILLNVVNKSLLCISIFAKFYFLSILPYLY
jgi:hypothetical protein